jgi:cell wall assembly regulator SMI1
VQPLDVPTPYAHLSMREMWTRVEDWLCSLPGGTDLLARLAGPASEADIASLRDAAGGWLPTDYVESLRCHAGNTTATSARTGAAYAVRLVTDVTWLPPPLVVAMRSWLREHYASFPVSPYARIDPAVRRAYYDPGWIPVIAADEDRALFWCIDTAPTEPARRGQILAMCTNDPDRDFVYLDYRAFFAHQLLDRIATCTVDSIVLEDAGLIELVG